MVLSCTGCTFLHIHTLCFVLTPVIILCCTIILEEHRFILLYHLYMVKMTISFINRQFNMKYYVCGVISCNSLYTPTGCRRGCDTLPKHFLNIRSISHQEFPFESRILHGRVSMHISGLIYE